MYKQNFVKNKRKEKGLSQARLASRAGLTQAAISRFETGLADLPVEDYEKVVNVLGYMIDLIPLPYQEQSPVEGIEGDNA